MGVIAFLNTYPVKDTFGTLKRCHTAYTEQFLAGTFERPPLTERGRERVIKTPLTFENLKKAFVLAASRRFQSVLTPIIDLLNSASPDNVKVTWSRPYSDTTPDTENNEEPEGGYLAGETNHQLCVVALKELKPGEEIGFNYGQNFYDPLQFWNTWGTFFPPAVKGFGAVHPPGYWTFCKELAPPKPEKLASKAGVRMTPETALSPSREEKISSPDISSPERLHSAAVLNWPTNHMARTLADYGRAWCGDFLSHVFSQSHLRPISSGVSFHVTPRRICDLSLAVSRTYPISCLTVCFVSWCRKRDASRGWFPRRSA